MKSNKNNKMTCGVKEDFLRILVCPLTKSYLKLDTKRCELISKEAKLAYPIIDGIPVLIPEKARKLK